MEPSRGSVSSLKKAVNISTLNAQVAHHGPTDKINAKGRLAPIAAGSRNTSASSVWAR